MRARFTDQVRQVVTQEHLESNWGGGRKNTRFRCYLCGHRFEKDEGFRWVYCAPLGVINFLTCDTCDGPDVRERWRDRVKEFYSDKFWGLRDDRHFT